MYNAKSQKAEEFICDSEIRETMAFAAENSANKEYVKEIIENIVIEEHLRGQKFATRLNLTLEREYIGSAALALGMSLGVASTADAEATEAAYLLDKLACIFILRGFGRPAIRLISAECEYIFNSSLTKICKLLTNALVS